MEGARQADDLGRNATLPGKAHGQREARTQVGGHLHGVDGADARPAADAKDVGHLEQGGVGLPHAREHVGVQDREGHQERDRHREPARRHPHEQQHHEGGHGGRLDGANQRGEKPFHHAGPARHRGKGHSGRDRQAKAGGDAPQREAHGDPEVPLADELRQPARHLGGAHQHYARAHRRARQLPGGKPERGHAKAAAPRTDALLSWSCCHAAGHAGP